MKSHPAVRSIVMAVAYAAVAGAATAQQTQLSAGAALGGANFPPPQPLAITLVPPASSNGALAAANFPSARPLTITLVPAPSPNAALGNANFPPPRGLILRLVPGGEAAPAKPAPIAEPAQRALTVTLAGSGAVTASVVEPGSTAARPVAMVCESGAANCLASVDDGARVTLAAVPTTGFGFGSWAGCETVTSAGCVVLMNASRTVTVTFTQLPAEPPLPTDPAPPAEPAGPRGNPLAVLGTANFPAPQLLGVTLVPPASPNAPLALANFPQARALAIMLVPPASPNAVLGSAGFPAPQSLKIALVPGGEVAPVAPKPAPATPTPDPEPAQRTTPPAAPVAGSTVYSVQIVQVIPRRGANFFDRTDPTGQTTVPMPAQFTVLAAAGVPAACAPGATVGPQLFIDGRGGDIKTTAGSGRIRLTPVGTSEIRFEFAIPGTNNLAGGSLGNVVPIVFTPNPAGNTVFIDDRSYLNNGVIRFGRDGANVCALRISFTFNGI